MSPSPVEAEHAVYQSRGRTPFPCPPPRRFHPERREKGQSSGAAANDTRGENVCRLFGSGKPHGGPRPLGLMHGRADRDMSRGCRGRAALAARQAATGLAGADHARDAARRCGARARGPAILRGSVAGRAGRCGSQAHDHRPCGRAGRWRAVPTVPERQVSPLAGALERPRSPSGLPSRPVRSLLPGSARRIRLLRHAVATLAGPGRGAGVGGAGSDADDAAEVGGAGPR